MPYLMIVVTHAVRDVEHQCQRNPASEINHSFLGGAGNITRCFKSSRDTSTAATQLPCHTAAGMNTASTAACKCISSPVRSARGFLSCPPSTAAAAHGRQHEGVKLQQGCRPSRTWLCTGNGSLLNPGCLTLGQALTWAV